MSDLSLLEYFAAHAPDRPEWWGKWGTELSVKERLDILAAWRWAYAEAMIANSPPKKQIPVPTVGRR